MDDQRIVELYWQRDEQAITETAAKYENYCYTIAYNILNNREDAEESVNDTYLGAWNSMPPHRPALLSTFLGKITRRISVDRYRRKNAEKRGGGEMDLALEELQACIADGGDPASEYERERLARLVNDFVLSLPETEQKVFLCRYWYVEPLDTISKRFGFSESKVKSMLHRSREKLRKLLIKEGFQ